MGVLKSSLLLKMSESLRSNQKYDIDNVVTCASKHLVGDQDTKENLEAEEEKDTTENK